MRLAANEIERSLQQAAEEPGPRRSASQLDDLASAFRQADEMRRTPFGIGFITGRKDGVQRQVLTTSFTEEHHGHTYRWVLLPYTPVQDANRRRVTPKYLYRTMRWNAKTEEYVTDETRPWSPKRPPRQSLEASGIEVRPLMPYNHHLQLVRDDRIRR